jgi:formate dehydrogenase maturation protein FdhE
MTKPSWDQRIGRAEELATAYPFASEVLRFYQKICSFQKQLYAHLVKSCGNQMEKRANGSLRDELDLIILLPSFRPFLSLVEQFGSATLAQAARELADEGPEPWMLLLSDYWAGDGDGESCPPGRRAAEPEQENFFARAFLQAYAEYLADHTEAPKVESTPSTCLLCRGKPQLGVLRPEGDGAKRSLVCSLCLTEWSYRRIVCPACGEEDEKKLSVYVTSRFEHVRVEACESCKTYLKTIDLTKNGLAVPVVDELAAIPLTLWARENGYTKLQSNLLGL